MEERRSVVTFRGRRCRGGRRAQSREQRFQRHDILASRADFEERPLERGEVGEGAREGGEGAGEGGAEVGLEGLEQEGWVEGLER